MTGEPQRRGPEPAPTKPSIPGYDVEAPIGRGASGVVYRARQLAVDRAVALKVLRVELSSNSRVVQRLKREARTTARLAHPNVISAIDMGEVDGRWWYAMELVEGGTLAELVKRSGRLEERVALRLFIPLVDALVHLAEHGVVHRDIKPANVLIDERTGLARLADLGLAFADDDPQRTQVSSGTLGTPAYMSPEQAVDATAADAQSDLWSLGATLFHAVVGRPPFEGASVAEVLTEVLHAPVPDPAALAPELSAGFALVLRKCLTRDRDQRYRSAAELLADLERVRERRAPRVRRADLEPSPRELRRRRALYAGAGLALLLTIGVLAIRFWPASPDPVTPIENAKYAPLASLEARVASADATLIGQYLRELQDVSAQAPVEARKATETLRVELRRRLRETISNIQTELEDEFGAALEASDYVLAEELLDDVDGRVLRRTGLAVDEIALHQMVLRTPETLRGELGRRLERTLRDLGRAANRWVGERRLESERAFERAEWRRAWELLDVSRTTILHEIGFVDARLSPQALDDVLSITEIELRLGRQRRLDEWHAIDQQLSANLEQHAGALARDLREDPGGAFDAGRDLRREFERALDAREIRIDELPDEFELSSAGKLLAQVGALRQVEDDVLRANVRDEFEAIGALGVGALRRREYASAAELWEELAAATERSFGIPESSWRARRREYARLRVAAARRLEGVLGRAAERVLEWNGREVELLLDGIPRTGKLVAGVRPLEGPILFVDARGQEIELSLRDMPPRTFESLMGWRRPRELAASERLDLALFLWASNEVDRARAVRRTIRNPASGLESELHAELGIDLEQLRATTEDRELARDRAATAKLQRALDPLRRAHSPASVLAEVEDLLENDMDLERVRERRADLEALRKDLEDDGQRSSPEEFERAYPGAVVTFPQSHRVRLAFDFQDEALPDPWDRGRWAYDGLGWSERKPSGSWAEFRSRRGLRLLLTDPIEWTAEGFRIELEFVPQQAGGRADLVVVSIGGLHVALVDGTLPGCHEFRPRWLVTDGTLEDLEKRIRAGQGARERRLWAKDHTASLVLAGSHRSGRMTVTLNGDELGTVRNLRTRDDTAQVIELRSWEELRVLRAALEAGR